MSGTAVLCKGARIRKLDNMTTCASKPTRNPITAAVAVVLALLIGVFWLPGCTDSTDPSGGHGPVTISFQPTAQGQEIDLSQEVDFSVNVTEVDTMAVNWWRGGVVVSNAATYTYRPSQLGVDTLRVQVAAGDVARNYYWTITVVASENTLPLPVDGVAADAGPEPGDVLVAWLRVNPGAYALDEYVVAVSHSGPITTANWDQTRELRRVPHRIDQAGYVATFTVADDGMIPGADAWFAVRAVDELGQMSPVSDNGFTNTTTAWWVDGVVRDDRDLTHPGVIVEAREQGLSTNTDNSGVFRLGPFRSIDQVVISTNSSNAPISGWFDFESAPLDSVKGRDYEILLITRHALDSSCTDHQGQFLNYLRFMARTRYSPNDPENTKQYKWDSYPVSVYLPEVVSGSGVNFADAVRFAMAFWDSVMGEPYFVETSDQATANVVGRFDLSEPSSYGSVRLLEPAGSQYELGNVIPEKVELYLWRSDLVNATFLKEVALHELGHVLGLLDHANCATAGYLMTTGVGGNLNQDHPIHPDEQNAVRCIRRLRQGVDMAGYSLN